jgi:hypothetical protein
LYRLKNAALIEVALDDVDNSFSEIATHILSQVQQSHGIHPVTFLIGILQAKGRLSYRTAMENNIAHGINLVLHAKGQEASKRLPERNKRMQTTSRTS